MPDNSNPSGAFTFEEATKSPPAVAGAFTFEEAQGATKQPSPSEAGGFLGGLAASASRGLAPYAAGAAVGGGLGSLAGGVGALPGAVAGAGAVALTDLATSVANSLGITHLPTISKGTDMLMDWFGVRRPQTSLERITQTGAAGLGSAVSGVGMARELSENVAAPVAKAIFSQLAERPGAQAASGVLSGVGSQTAAEAGAGPEGQQLAGFIGSTVPFAKPSLGGVARIDPKQAAKAAIDKGYVLPPVEAAEGGLSSYSAPSALSAWSGKIKMGQYAATKNQPVTNRLAAEDLGLPSETTLTPSAFDAVRAREGKVYDEVAQSVPEVDLARDKEFVSDVNAIGKRSAETEKLFPSTQEPPGVVALRSELLANARGNTKAVMNYIADLRFKATQNFKAAGDAMAHRMGFAQREAANALEEAMERSVKNAPAYYEEKLADAVARKGAADAAVDYAAKSRIPKLLERAERESGAAFDDVEEWKARVEAAKTDSAKNQDLVDRFRSARRMMAKSYDVESVTNASTGDVSAAGLGRLLQRGKPITGNLKIIADSANHFPRSFQNPAAFGGVEPLSVLDTLAAAAAMAHGSPGVAATVLGRPIARAAVLSPRFQRAMISPPTEQSVPFSVWQAMGGQPNAVDDLGVEP